MTAQVIDFQEAKERILGRGTKDETAAVTPALSNALEVFSFSRLPKRERILRTVTTALNSGGFTLTAEALTHLIDQIEPSLPNDIFSKPLPKR